MKPTFINIRVLGTTALALLFATSCSDILDEQPRSIYEPTFFQTEKGVEGGITSMYAHLRYIYGQAYYYNSCLTGTDEATYAQSADGNFKDADLSGVGSLTASSSRSDVRNRSGSLRKSYGDSETIRSASSSVNRESIFSRIASESVILPTIFLSENRAACNNP